MEKQNAYIDMPQGRYVSSNRASNVAAVMAGAGLLLGGLGAGATYRQADREAEQNPLELRCEQLSERGTSVKGIDGTVYKLTCDEYGNPVLQEGEE